MLISRETDYAIRILRFLADGEQRVIADICESEQIPKRFGYKIVEKLQNAGMLHCSKGKGGGCRLVANLKQVSLFDVVAAVGNDSCLNQCLVPGHVCPWQEAHTQPCKVHKNLSVMQDGFTEQLKNMTIYSVMFE